MISTSFVDQLNEQAKRQGIDIQYTVRSGEVMAYTEFERAKAGRVEVVHYPADDDLLEGWTIILYID